MNACSRYDREHAFTIAACGSPLMAPVRRPDAATEELRASLVDHARRIVTRDGRDGLTMRALAVEAGCATGLPYKVFSDRRELVVAVLRAEMDRLAEASADLKGRAATGTVAANLSWFAEVLLDSPAVALVPEVMSDHDLSDGISVGAQHREIGPVLFETAIGDYLALERRAGRIRANADTAAFAFVLAGAVHNLVVSGPAWPRPTRAQLRRHVNAVVAALTP
jgi:AcrR family transcriptional regulator